MKFGSTLCSGNSILNKKRAGSTFDNYVKFSAIYDFVFRIKKSFVIFTYNGTAIEQKVAEKK
mgnify:CR=1 FL=1